MNIYVIVISVFIVFLIISILSLLLFFNVKNIRKFLPGSGILVLAKLNKNLKQLLSQADRKTRRSFKTKANFFIHINTSDKSIIDNESDTYSGMDLYKISGPMYNHYLFEQAYILELHKLNDKHVYKELGKYCRKVSLKSGKIPTLVYSFKYSDLQNKNHLLEELKSLRSVVYQLYKIYKKIPKLVLSVIDIDDHPCYKTFITCVSEYEVSLLSPSFEKAKINEDVRKYYKQLHIWADNKLFKKNAQMYLRFSYFINDISSYFENIIAKLDYVDSNEAIGSISLYVNSKSVDDGKGLFLSYFDQKILKTKVFKQVIAFSISFLSIVSGIVLLVNDSRYRKIIGDYKKDLDTISVDIKDSKKTVDLSDSYEDIVKGKLIDSSIYPASMLNKGIEINEGIKIQQQLLKLLKSDASLGDSIYRTYIYLILIAPQNTDLKELVKSNIQIFTSITKVDDKTILAYINSPVPDVKVEIVSNDEINDSVYQDLVIKSDIYQMAESYIVDNNNINLRTLHDFLDKTELPMLKLKIIDKFMKNIYPKMKNSLEESDRKFLTDLYKIIVTNVGHSNNIERVKMLVPSVKDVKVHDLKESLDILKNLNNELNSHISPNIKIGKPLVEKIIMLATYNDIMNNLLLSKPKLVSQELINNSTVNIADNGAYNGNIPIMYTKIGLEKIILPEIKNYHSILEILKKYKIDTSGLENYYDDALQEYILGYKKSYIDLVASYKNNVSANDIASSLLLISSPGSQFNNMLRVLLDNTNFDEETLKSVPDLVLISSYFKNINSMISNPNDMEQYDQIIRSIADQINNSKDKEEAINEITLNLSTKSKESDLYKVNALLKKNNINSENAEIFTAPLKSIMRFGKPYLVKYKYDLWQNDIMSKIDEYKKYYPFSNDSNKIMTAEELTGFLGPKGDFWKTVNKDMYGIFEYKDNIWKAKDIDLFGDVNTEKMLNTLNNVQQITNTLWDESGNPQIIDVKVKPELALNSMLANNTFVKMTILNIGDSKIIGISSNQSPMTIPYKWFEKQSASVGYIDTNEQINSFETHTSYWSFIELINKATKDNNVYTWIQNGIKIKFEIDFNNVFKILDNITKENK